MAVAEPLNFQNISIKDQEESFRNEKLCGKSYTAGWLLDSLRGNDEEFKRLHGNRKIERVCFHFNSLKAFYSSD